MNCSTDAGDEGKRTGQVQRSEGQAEGEAGGGRDARARMITDPAGG